MRRQSLAIPLIAIVALVLGGTFGLLATRLSLGTVIFTLLSLAAVWVVFRRPEFAILFILAMSSSILNLNTLPRLGGFSSVDLALIFLLGLLLVRVLARKDTLVRTPLDWPIFLFFLAGTIANLNGMFYLGTVDLFRNPVWRLLLNYMIFFAVTNFVTTRRQL